MSYEYIDNVALCNGCHADVSKPFGHHKNRHSLNQNKAS